MNKIILEVINSELRVKLEINQWKNTNINRLVASSKNKHNCEFIQRDKKRYLTFNN